MLDDLQLASDFGFDHQLPVARDDRQVLQRPTFVITISLRWCCLQQMAHAPGDGDPLALQTAVVTPGGLQHAGDIAGLRWFFANKQAHTSALSVRYR
ncbi:hypothetical protein D3C75_1170460 [compost metagenome]